MNEEKEAITAASGISAASVKTETKKSESQKSGKPALNAAKDGASEKSELSVSATGLISIDDLTKVELKVGRILSAEIVEGADKLLRISLDLGEEKPRNVIAGIRVAYAPEDLKDVLVVAVANLQPRKMKFGISEAMLLAAGEGEKLSLFTPHRSALPGDRLR
jgi:methionyl-tRNA synthetase